MPNEPVDNKGTTGAKLETIPSPVEQLAKELASKVVNAATIQVEDIKYIWDGYLQAERLGLLIGDGGIGKGMLTDWIFAQASRGELPGDYQGKQMKSLFISSEEHYNSETVPRLKAQDADLSMIDVLDPQDYYLQLDNMGCEALCMMMRDEGIQLVHIDPLIDFFPSDKRDTEVDVRSVLSPLGQAAREYGVTVVGLRHVPKGNRNMEDLILGSKAWRNSARSAIGILKHPEESDLRVAFNLKMNNAPGEDKGRCFKIENTIVEKLQRGIGRLVWTDDSYSMSDLEEMHGRNSKEKEAVSDKKRVEDEAVRMYFRKYKGEVPAKQAVAELRAILNKSRATVFRIAERVGVDKGKQGDSDSVWTLQLDSKSDEGYEPLHPF